MNNILLNNKKEVVIILSLFLFIIFIVGINTFMETALAIVITFELLKIINDYLLN